MLHAIASLTPIVLLVAGGAALLGLGFYSNEFRRGLDRLVYWVALPALIIGKLAEGGAMNLEAGAVLGALLLATAGTIVLAYGLAWWMGLPGPALGAFVQATFRGNLAFVGLPVIVLAVEGDQALTTRAVLVLAPMVLIYNAAAVPILQLARHRLDRRLLPRLARSLVTNPLLLSCAIGLIWGLTGLEMPGPLHETLRLTGATAAPLALLSLGGALVTYRVRDHLGRATAASLMKVAVTPALAWGIGLAMGLEPGAMLVLMVFASAPTAVASYVLSVQLGGDEGLAASTIVLSTVLSAASIGIALALTA